MARASFHTVWVKTGSDSPETRLPVFPNNGHRQTGAVGPFSAPDSDLLDLTDEVVAKALTVRRDSADRRVWKMDWQDEG